MSICICKLTEETIHLLNNNNLIKIYAEICKRNINKCEKYEKILNSKQFIEMSGFIYEQLYSQFITDLSITCKKHVPTNNNLCGYINNVCPNGFNMFCNLPVEDHINIHNINHNFISKSENILYIESIQNIIYEKYNNFINKIYIYILNLFNYYLNQM